MYICLLCLRGSDFLLFFFYSPGDHRDLHVLTHSFPTRRSSDRLARKRGWRNLQLLSTASNDYSHHYFGDTSKFGAEMRDARGYEPGENWDEPMYNVFRKDADGTVRHFWGSELLY